MSFGFLTLARCDDNEADFSSFHPLQSERTVTEVSLRLKTLRLPSRTPSLALRRSARWPNPSEAVAEEDEVVEVSVDEVGTASSVTLPLRVGRRRTTIALMVMALVPRGEDEVVVEDRGAEAAGVVAAAGAEQRGSASRGGTRRVLYLVVVSVALHCDPVLSRFCEAIANARETASVTRTSLSTTGKETMKFPLPFSLLYSLTIYLIRTTDFVSHSSHRVISSLQQPMPLSIPLKHLN